MNESFSKFIVEAPEAIGNFPDLQLCSRENSFPYLHGDIILFDENGVAYDSYSIRMESNNDYPNSFPRVYETKGRLPHNIDWHVYTDGHFCICTELEEYIHCSKGITLRTFIQNHVVPYLHNQSFREKEGYFVNERSHGSKGILESLCSLLNTYDFSKAYSLLDFIYKNDTPSRTSKCFCGSSKKYRHCHREAYQAIKSIGQEKIKSVINSLLY